MSLSITHDRKRQLRDNAKATDGLIWVVDSNDRERFPESYEEFNTINRQINLEASKNRKCAVPMVMWVIGSRDPLLY